MTAVLLRGISTPLSKEGSFLGNSILLGAKALAFLGNSILRAWFMPTLAATRLALMSLSFVFLHEEKPEAEAEPEAPRRRLLPVPAALAGTSSPCAWVLRRLLLLPQLLKEREKERPRAPAALTPSRSPSSATLAMHANSPGTIRPLRLPLCSSSGLIRPLDCPPVSPRPLLGTAALDRKVDSL